VLFLGDEFFVVGFGGSIVELHTLLGISDFFFLGYEVLLEPTFANELGLSVVFRF